MDDDDPIVGLDDGATASSLLETIQVWAPECQGLLSFVTHLEDFSDEDCGKVYSAVYSLAMSRATADLLGGSNDADT